MFRESDYAQESGVDDGDDKVEAEVGKSDESFVVEGQKTVESAVDEIVPVAGNTTDVFNTDGLAVGSNEVSGQGDTSIQSGSVEGEGKGQLPGFGEKDLSGSSGEGTAAGSEDFSTHSLSSEERQSELYLADKVGECL